MSTPNPSNNNNTNTNTNSISISMSYNSPEYAYRCKKFFELVDRLWKEHRAKKAAEAAAQLVEEEDFAAFMRGMDISREGDALVALLRGMNMSEKGEERARPGLASRVRQFSMVHGFNKGLESQRQERCSRELKVVDVPEIVKSVIEASSHSTEEEQAWLRHVTWIDMDDALLALLLPALMRLEMLTVTLSRYDYPYFGRMIKRAALKQKPFNTQPAFSSLFYFKQIREKQECTNPQYIASILKLPSIHKIISDAIGSRALGKAIDWGPPRCASLASLELRDYCLDSTNINKLLNIPTALNKFVLELSDRRLLEIEDGNRPSEDWESRDSAIYLPDVQKALTAQKDHLRFFT